MTQMDIVTKLIPIILVVCIVYFNMRRMQKNLKVMKKEQNANSCARSCGGSCKGCSSSASCTSVQEKTQDNKK